MRGPYARRHIEPSNQLTRRNAFFVFLRSAFTPASFRAWLTVSAEHPTLLDDLPPEQTTANEFFSEVVAVLLHHGALTPTFFERLIVERPARRAEIEAIMALPADTDLEPPTGGSPRAWFLALVAVIAVALAGFLAHELSTAPRDAESPLAIAGEPDNPGAVGSPAPPIVIPGLPPPSAATPRDPEPRDPVEPEDSRPRKNNDPPTPKPPEPPAPARGLVETVIPIVTACAWDNPDGMVQLRLGNTPTPTIEPPPGESEGDTAGCIRGALHARWSEVVAGLDADDIEYVTVWFTKRAPPRLKNILREKANDS